MENVAKTADPRTHYSNPIWSACRLAAIVYTHHFHFGNTVIYKMRELASHIFFSMNFLEVASLAVPPSDTRRHLLAYILLFCDVHFVMVI